MMTTTAVRPWHQRGQVGLMTLGASVPSQEARQQRFYLRICAIGPRCSLYGLERAISLHNMWKLS